MTAQAGETLIFDGQEHTMCTTPLSNYFDLGGTSPGFGRFCTALWRGYVGTWEIVNDRLYMTALEGSLEDGSPANLETVFPGYPDRVFAHWYSGEIRVPQGKLLEYVHGGFASTYEKDIFLIFKNGVLVERRVKENGKSTKESASEGYVTAAWTVLPSSGKE